MAGPAVETAFEEIERLQMLPSYSLNAEFYDSGCNSLKGLGAAYNALSTKEYHIMIGPQCSSVCSSVGRLAAHVNIPVFTGLCQGVEMSNKNQFKTMTRLLATFEMTGLFVMNILEKLNWKIVGVLAERRTDLIWRLTRDGLKYAAQIKNITLVKSILFHETDDLESLLLLVAAKSRRITITVIIIGAHGDTFRTLAKLIYKHKLHLRRFFFIVITYYEQRRIFGDFAWKQKANTQFGFNYKSDEKVPYPAANLYEATILSAISLNETIATEGDIKDGMLVAQRLWNRSYDSLTGGMTLNSNGDREQKYTILQLDTNDQMTTVAIYTTENESLMWIRPILWVDGEKPLDIPRCGFDNELCEEDVKLKLVRIILIIVGVFGIVLIFGLGGFLLIFKKMKWEKDLASMSWKLDLNDIQFHDSTVKPFNSALSISRSKTTLDNYSISFNKFEQIFTKTGYFKGIIVALKSASHVKQVNLNDRNFLTELKHMHDLSHNNICKFMGVTVEVPDLWIVTEYCSKGSLQDLLANDDVNLDWTFKSSLALDIVSSSNCVIDGRFVVKITDFGLMNWRTEKLPKDLLWTSPEGLRDSENALNMKSDIYSFSIILHEIIYREGPFFCECDTLSADGIIQKVLSDRKLPFRPFVKDDYHEDTPEKIIQLMRKCWNEQPENRPNFNYIKATLIASVNHKSLSIMDNLINRMEQYANNLETLVEERTSSYLEEKKRAEDLLYRLLPPSIAKEIQKTGNAKPQDYECVTIYFSDIVSFTVLSSKSTPLQIIKLLNDLYTLFDSVIEKFDVYKVETIGDSYMVVSGLPKKNDNSHAENIAKMSIILLNAIKTFEIHHRPGEKLLLRIGIHSGPCAAGVVGLTMPRYCLFGDTVNTASRMETHGEPLKIHMSKTTNDLLRRDAQFSIQERGELEIKGKGKMLTYWLDPFLNEKQM
ncbi:DgyrCDS12157 [Dimorphilus gyrociliatus]|uniref:Guanylate cyclase n=1 Tax=Dimorphilus gyrociliatus TaxID=2664684 RepID=A0A7I8W8H6_9ANNE|nr:DgyrCDS12157 [Dimorphilus gyrociliatus]